MEKQKCTTLFAELEVQREEFSKIKVVQIITHQTITV